MNTHINVHNLEGEYIATLQYTLFQNDQLSIIFAKNNDIYNDIDNLIKSYQYDLIRIALGLKTIENFNYIFVAFIDTEDKEG